MRILIFFSIATLCSHLDAGTTTKINYLPNGKVGGYELIINNTAPGLDLQPSGRPLPLKQANKILRTDSTFTRIDERVEGDNVFVNIQSLITRPKEKPRFPVSAVLTVPSKRLNVDGKEENVKLTFAKIGPYAALIVPVENHGESAGSGYSIPPEIRNSIKSFIEVSDDPTSEEEENLPKSTEDTFLVGRRGEKCERCLEVAEPYGPGKFSYNAKKIGHSHHSGGRAHDSTKTPSVRSFQTRQGLIINLSNNNLTLFAPNAGGGDDKQHKSGDSNELHPNGGGISVKSVVTTHSSTQVEQTKRLPYYHSFSLSEHPPSISSQYRAPVITAKEHLPVQGTYGLPPYRTRLIYKQI